MIRLQLKIGQNVSSLFCVVFQFLTLDDINECSNTTMKHDNADGPNVSTSNSNFCVVVILKYVFKLFKYVKSTVDLKSNSERIVTLELQMYMQTNMHRKEQYQYSRRPI